MLCLTGLAIQQRRFAHIPARIASHFEWANARYGFQNMMRTEEPRPVRLSEYRPPDWLVETVDLDFRLHPTQTPVRATLKLKPNPAAGAPAPLVLDGDGLTLVSLKLDGETLAGDRYLA